MALFLFAQLYIRQSQMQFTMDVWPASPGDQAPSSTSPRAAAGESTSPGRKVLHNNSGGMLLSLCAIWENDIAALLLFAWLVRVPIASCRAQC